MYIYYVVELIDSYFERAGKISIIYANNNMNSI